MIVIIRETYEINGAETIADDDKMLWLNEKHTEEGVTHKNLTFITRRYFSNYEKHNYD